VNLQGFSPITDDNSSSDTATIYASIFEDATKKLKVTEDNTSLLVISGAVTSVTVAGITFLLYKRRFF